MLELNTIGIVLHDPAQEYPLGHLQDFFGQSGKKVVPLWRDSQPPPGKIDLILALGGDGTVLHALGRFPQVPVLAVNFGSLGFLTAGEHHDLDRLLERLLQGEYFIETRLVLRGTFGQISHEIINEVVVRGVTKMVSVDVCVDGRFVHTVRGDGVIVGTPTGSTSYLMSTGASIVSPLVDCMILSGINEHRFASRSVILPPASIIQLTINPATREEEPFVVFDGREKYALKAGDTVAVTCSPVRAQLVFFEEGYFLKNLKSRLDW